jgi:hypothetical protein
VVRRFACIIVHPEYTTGGLAVVILSNMASKYPKIINFLKRKAPADDGENVSPTTPTQNDSNNKGGSEETSKLVKIFQTSWLQVYPWLKFENGKMFCTVCSENGGLRPIVS